jgi:hypothetical protein
MALVLAETAVGGLAVLWATSTWGRLRPGFLTLVGAVLAACAALAWLAARAPLDAAAGGAPRAARALLAALAALTVCWLVLHLVGASRASRVVGVTAVPVGTAALVALAVLPGAAHGAFLGVAQLVSGALFLGSVVDGLLLGHWYLVDRRASREPLRRMGVLLLAGSVAAIATTLAGAGGGGTARPELSPLLGAGALTVALAVGLGALCVVIGVLIRALVKEDSIQAATGFFYLAVVLAFAAEFAAKVRFY